MSMEKLKTAQKCIKRVRVRGKDLFCSACSPFLSCPNGVIKLHVTHSGSESPTRALACSSHARAPTCWRGMLSTRGPFSQPKHCCNAFRLCRTVRLGHTQDTIGASARSGTFWYRSPWKALSSSRMNLRRSSSTSRRLTSRRQCHVAANQTKRNHTMQTADDSTK